MCECNEWDEKKKKKKVHEETQNADPKTVRSARAFVEPTGGVNLGKKKHESIPFRSRANLLQ